MNKILVLVEKDHISFSKYNRSISEENLNNTNVINVKNLKFTEEYILENLDLVSTFLNLIFIKFKMNSIVIKDLEIAEVVLKTISKLNIVKKVVFIPDKELSYVISTLLYENKNLEKIECYNLPEIMFYRFEKSIIKTRSKILSTSNFLKNNNISTYSELHNKDRIVIDEFLNDDDIDDMVYFFNTNINLKKIEFKRYSRQNLVTILKFLKKNSVKNVNIIIYETSLTTEEILKDVKAFDKLNKQYSVKIKVKYSKEYKEKNRIKELNIVMFRNIIIGCIIIFSIFFLLYKLLENNDHKKINKLNDELNDIMDSIETIEQVEQEIIEEKKEEYISSYYQTYSKVFNELLALNPDTVGWLTVNNTKVNYPVVQTTDNEYYLTHAYDNSKNIAGWIYADYRNNMNDVDKNTILYGHSGLKGNLMFSSLTNVLNKTWYTNENNLNIMFSLQGNEYIWKIFSIYTIDVTSDYLYTTFSTDNDYIKFLDMIKKRSINDFNVEVGSSDRILTLSTCYKDDKKRLVVHAKLMM